MYCEKSLSRFWEIYHLIEYHISIWPDFALSTVFFYLCFYERQADKPARPIGWLGSCERKYCLLCREKVSWKNFEPFWRNMTSKISCPGSFCQNVARSPDLFSMFLWMPGWQTSAANWMTRFMCKEILFTLRREVLWKNFEPFWRNVTSKIVFSCMFLSIYCYERLFAVTDVSMNANRTN